MQFCRSDHGSNWVEFVEKLEQNLGDCLVRVGLGWGGFGFMLFACVAQPHPKMNWVG